MRKRFSRVIQVKSGVVSPREPRPRTVVARKITDYPEVPDGYLEVARNYSHPLLAGPPICDELIALVMHMFTEEEAAVVRHMKPFSRKSAADLAAAEHRPLGEVLGILSRLADELHILLRTGKGDDSRYLLMPLVPGTFEFVLMGVSVDTLTAWHRRFAELFEALFETGFLIDYLKHPAPGMRYLPVMKVVEVLPMAYPSERLEEILDRYRYFAVGNCQCRMSEHVMGEGCGKPMQNCIWIGDYAEVLVKNGQMRQLEKRDVLEIKAEAEAHGLVTWINNEDSGRGTQVSCSCCGCCCKMMRTVNEFNMPGMIAPPRYLPQVDEARCNYCAKCALACPMGALTVDTKGKDRTIRMERCIGCGLCVLACDKKHAITMEDNPRHKEPSKDLTSMLLRMTPNLLRNAYSGWKGRR
jgi:Pyruvate/2-oxoacid:ferredoxin oxidoreductase delta subunit